MAALQKFKLLATQCGVVQSPTRSPRTSPLVHLRRKKTTLRMLLTRSSSSTRRSPRRRERSPGDVPEKKKDTLKDLFVSSPANTFEEDEERKENVTIGGKCQVFEMKVSGLGGEPAAGSPRPGWIGFRHRSLIRRPWRPMLVTIVEEEDERNSV